MRIRFRSVPTLAALAAIAWSCAALQAQGRHELAFSGGAGSMVVNGKGSLAPVFSVSYQFHFTHHISAEGALDFFSWEFETGSPVEPLYRDGYSGAQAAVVYSLRDNRQTGKFIPFLAAGVGKTTTDFTEIAAHVYYRIGGGVSYHFSEKWGIRLEFRNETVTDFQYGRTGNLPSARFGLVYRF